MNEIQRYSIARRLTLLCYFTLLATIFYGSWVNGPDDIAARVVLWLLMSSGLLLIIVGLLKGKKRSYLWLCYILLLYFVFCVQFLFSGDGTTASVAEAHEAIALAAIVIGFSSAIAVSRLSEKVIS